MAERIRSVSGTTSVCPAWCCGGDRDKTRRHGSPPPVVAGVPGEAASLQQGGPCAGTPGGSRGQQGDVKPVEQDEPFLVPMVGFRKPLWALSMAAPCGASPGPSPA